MVVGIRYKMKVNFEINGNAILLQKELNKDETYKVRDSKGIFSLHIFKKPQMTTGVTSYCDDSSHVLFIDYDNVCRWIVEKELESIAQLYDTPIYLFKTKEEKIDKEVVGNYHAICLRKFHAFEINRLLREQTSCDVNFVSMPRRSVFRSWVLRISNKRGSNKPKFVKLMGYGLTTCNTKISEAHLKFLNTIYKLPTVEYTNKDGLSKVYFNKYETRDV